MHHGPRAVVIALAASVMAGTAVADLTSASYRLRGSHFSAGATSALSSTSFSGTAASGQSQAIGFSGSASDLGTSASGFMPILAGALPSLDSDADGVAFHLDDDDDGDGLLDVNETNTGVFVSAADTGTDSLSPDSDADGFSDGDEVAAGSNPNDPLSTPGGAQLPTLGYTGLFALVLTMLASSRALLRRSRRTP